MKKGSDILLCCDWGTSYFRIRLVNRKTFAVLAENGSEMGIATVFQQWNESKSKDRIQFYLEVVDRHLDRLAKIVGDSLKNTPVIVSGMASSTLGVMEVEYTDLPFGTDGSALKVQRIASTKRFQHDVHIISGVKGKADVMRGEEAQIVGAVSKKQGNHVILLPGTHCKHAFIENGEVVDFKTYMTGEFFELLSKKSILSSSIENDGKSFTKGSLTSFKKGLSDIQHGNILNASFRVRSNKLLNKTDPQQNYYYLSGLLIGQELNDLVDSSYRSIKLISDTRLEPFYICAVKNLLPEWKMEIENARKATIRGQVKIYENYKSNA